jgi:hypothetical protein
MALWQNFELLIVNEAIPWCFVAAAFALRKLVLLYSFACAAGTSFFS